MVHVRGDQPDQLVNGAGIIVGYDEKSLYLVTAKHLLTKAHKSSADEQGDAAVWFDQKIQVFLLLDALLKNVRCSEGDLDGNGQLNLRNSPSFAAHVVFFDEADRADNEALRDVVGLVVARRDVPPEWINQLRFDVLVAPETVVPGKTHVRTIGYPEGKAWTCGAKGERVFSVSSDTLDYAYGAFDAEGNSGGPVVTGRHELVGMARHNENELTGKRGTALAIVKVLDLLRSAGFTVRLSSAAPDVTAVSDTVPTATVEVAGNTLLGRSAIHADCVGVGRFCPLAISADGYFPCEGSLALRPSSSSSLQYSLQRHYATWDRLRYAAYGTGIAASALGLVLGAMSLSGWWEFGSTPSSAAMNRANTYELPARIILPIGIGIVTAAIVVDWRLSPRVVPVEAVATDAEGAVFSREHLSCSPSK
jgi:hypothetical protein